MAIIGLVTTQFSASHQVEQDPICSYQHGHLFHVRVELIGAVRYTKDGLGWEREMAAKVLRVTEELNLRDLNTLLPGVPTTAEGLAFYLYERIGGGVSAIEVMTDNFGSRVTFEVPG